jgi:hypothetical protein
MEEAAKETVVIVHGTYAAPKSGVRQWYQPDEGTLETERWATLRHRHLAKSWYIDACATRTRIERVPATQGFTSKLNDALQKRGSAARCWAHCRQGDQGFHWSAKNNWIDRTEAASELGNYVRKLQNKGWCCHIVAHSHGGNVVLEALPQITTALSSNAPLGKIVTLGTPFMDTRSPIQQRITRDRRIVIRGTWINLILLLMIILPAVIWLRNFTWHAAVLGLAVAMVVVAFAIVFVSFSGKSHTAKPIAQMQPKFLAIGSPMDEPWQLLRHMRNASNPMAVQTNLIRYVISSMQSRISRSYQVARIYGAKSYRDLKPVAKSCFVLAHLMFVLSIFSVWQLSQHWGHWGEFHYWEDIWWWFSIGSGLVAVLFTLIFGTELSSVLGSPGRWCVHRLGAIKGIFGEIATYIVRSRGWSVVLAIAMGLEGYRHQLPLIEQSPSSVPGIFVTYEDMPTGAQQRALAKRGAWIDRHLNDVAQTFSKLVVTSADIALLLRAIEADETLVHAAYYTDDECIARIADWIAGKDDPLSNAVMGGEAHGVA